MGHPLLEIARTTKKVAREHDIQATQVGSVIWRIVFAADALQRNTAGTDTFWIHKNRGRVILIRFLRLAGIFRKFPYGAPC